WLCAVESFKTLDTGHLPACREGDRAQDARGPCTARDGRSRTRPYVRKKVFSLVTFFAPAKKVTRDIQSRKLWLLRTQQQRQAPPSPPPSPASGRGGKIKSWIPASAGMTSY